MTTFAGTAGDDKLNGTADADTIIGLAGDDTIDGGAGADTIYGDGAAYSVDGDGNDQLTGGAGNDTIWGGGGNDTIYGNADDDWLNGGQGSDFLDGGDGNDALSGFGDSGYVDDHIADVLIGGAGDDGFSAGYGDTVDGGSGTDRLSYNAFGASAGIIANFAQLTAGATITVAGATLTGIEFVEGIGGTDYDDTIIAGAATNDIVYIDGYGGNDRIIGTSGRDTINGGDGNDTLSGGLGYDSMTGGTGIDTYAGTAAELNGDSIGGLEVGESIVITNANFGNFAFSFSGGVLHYTGGAISVSGDIPGRLVASAAATGGVRISVEERPVATVDQLAHQLTTDFWQWNGETPHHFNVTQGGAISVDIHTLNAAEQSLARSAFAAWHDIIGVNFQEVTSGAQITITHEESSDKKPHAYTEDVSSGGFITSARIHISSSWVNQYGSGLYTYSYETYIHEIGHALGLGHAGNYNVDADYAIDATYANDGTPMSVMSYFNQLDSRYFNGQGFSRVTVATPMQADIVAMQSLYGLSTTTRTGDTVYGFHSNAGGIYDASYGNVAFTIFDDGGTDTLDYSLSSSFQEINLNAETFSRVNGVWGGLSIARGVVIENAIGGSGNDTIYGNSADNVLIGGGGVDAIFAGAGNDRIIYDAVDYTPFVTGEAGFDTLVVIDQAAPLTYNLVAGSFEAAEVTQHDAANANSWSTLITNYDAYWNALNQDMRNDDGGRTWSVFDAANAQTWNQVSFNYDAAGAQVSEDYRYDNGTRSWTALDAYDAQSWSQVWFTYNPSGQQISEDYRYDDGERSWVSIDASNAQSWTQAWFTSDAAGHQVSEDYRYDNGTRSWVAFDASGARPWDHIWFTFDAAGHQTSDDRYNDNGTRIWTAYDADSNQAWGQDAFYYDASGHLYQQVTTWDDGHTTTTLL